MNDTTTELEKQLEEDMTSALAAATFLNGSPVESELVRLNKTILQLYDRKRQQMTDLLARQAEERVRTINDYTRQMSDLKHRADEALRLLEERHMRETFPLQELLARIEGMRE